MYDTKENIKCIYYVDPTLWVDCHGFQISHVQFLTFKRYSFRNNSYGIEQNKEGEDFEEISTLLENMQDYMEREIRGNEELNYLLPKCKNRHAECARWAHLGKI